MFLPRVGALGAAVALAGLAVFGTTGVASAAPKPKPTPTKSNCPNPAGHYPPGQCKDKDNGKKAQVEMGDNTPAPGQKTNVHGENFQPNSDVRVYTESSRTLLGTFRTNADGVFDGEVTIPRDLSAGAHRLLVEGKGTGGEAATASAPFVIKGDAAGEFINLPNTGGTGAGGNQGLGLPRTGGEIALTGVIGVGCVGLGGAAIASGRRRRLTV